MSVRFNEYIQRQMNVPTSENVYISESISVIEKNIIRYTSKFVYHRMHCKNKTHPKTILQLVSKSENTQEIAEHNCLI